MRKRSVGVRAWAQMLGLEKTVLEGVELGEHDELVVSVRPRYSQLDRCPHCRWRCPGYDLGDGRRRWRALDLGTTFCYLEADAPRVECKRHGVVVAGGPAVHEDAVVLDKAGTGFITATVDNGVVKSLSGDSLTVTEGLRSVTYKTVTLTIPANATVMRNFNKATLSDLKTGDRVHVAQSSDGTTVFADDGTQRPPRGGRDHFGPGGPGGPDSDPRPGAGPGPGFGAGGPPPVGG